VYETLPAIVDRIGASYPKLGLELREVFGGEIPHLLSDGAHDIALCPRTGFSSAYSRSEVRREPFVVATSSSSPLSTRELVALSDLADELFELWPREMAPGFYDAVVSACRDAGFEPRLDEHAAGSTVWGSIAKERGIGLVVRSLVDQLPRGIRLVELTEPRPALIIDLVWHHETAPPAVRHIATAASEVATERGWVVRSGRDLG
jgi:DNA-binding transcriptional LysR family regulator